ncbi:hypothetical protein LTR08_004244 [Meristemomyces frigidus]|nr:hypothetical protein LTR08_004244 [Meristemomyces frigidus]
MSDQDFYSPPQGPPPQHSHNNPFQQSEQERSAWGQQPGHAPKSIQQQPNQPQQYSQQDQSQQDHQQSQQQPSQQGQNPQGQQASYGALTPGQPPRRADTFEETAFVADDERGEQREALEQFEMSKGHQSQEDRDMETLQREFPAIDGSLIAALYGDSGNLSGTREMLGELGGGN